MPSSKTLIRELCARIAPVTAGKEREQCARAGGTVQSLARRVARMQGLAEPRVTLKGMALLAADLGNARQGSQAVQEWLGRAGVLQALSAHCDVKWLVADVGLREDFSSASFGSQILPRLLRRISPQPEQAVWDSMQEGVRLVCRMKGKGTDILGLGFLGTYEPRPGSLHELGAMEAWPIAVAAGFLLGASDLQTPVVISGEAAAAAVTIASLLAKTVSDYVLLAQPLAAAACPLEELPLLQWRAPDPLAVILGLDFCQSAAMLNKSDLGLGNGKAV